MIDDALRREAGCGCKVCCLGWFSV